MPAVIFKTSFMYDWHICGENHSGSSKGDFLDYITRPGAFRSENHQEQNDEFYDFLEYMRNDDKSDGAFDPENNLLTAAQLSEYRELEKTSKSEGCPKYIGVISFDNDFLRKNGILIGDTLNSDKLKDIARLGVNALITNSNKFENDNVYWVGAIHTNTDNVHIHYSICEKHRTRNRIETDRNQDCIELSAIKALKSVVANNIIGKTRSEEITRIKRQIIFPDLSDAMGTAENLITDLAYKLPENIALQYGNHRMKPFQSEIDRCVDKIIESNVQLKEEFKLYKSSIESLDEQYREFYGDNSKASMYSEHQLDDFYNRAGNILLKHIKTMRKNLSGNYNSDDKEDELEKKISAFAVSERKENDLSPAVINHLRRNNNYISNYAVSGKLAEILKHLPENSLQSNLDFLKDLSPDNDTAAFALGLYYLRSDNSRLAKPYLQKSSENNNSDAQYQLGKLYLREKKTRTAEPYLRMSADNGNSFAQFSYGMLLYNSSRKEQGYHYLFKADESGNKIAHKIVMNLKKRDEINSPAPVEKDGQYQIGRMYMHTDNLRKPEKLLTAAAEQNNSLAQYQLGKLYLNDNYRNLDKARMWLKLSAENDNQFGQIAYGVLEYKLGNHKLGNEYLNRAAESGNNFAQKLLTDLNRVRGAKPPRVRQAVLQSVKTSQACWYTLKQIINDYENHIRKLQAEFDYENNISASDDYGYDYEY